ncbi:MAG: CPBP family glutamic-type intramembrane protease [Planctomycetota bacterium]
MSASKRAGVDDEEWEYDAEEWEYEEDPDEEDSAEWEDEEWDDEEDDVARGPGPPGRGLAVGVVAMLPLFLAYDLAVDGPDGPRSVAEAILTRPLEPLGAEALSMARRASLAVAALGCFIAFAVAHRHAGGPSLAQRVGVVVLEGAICALLLGPLLLGASRLAEPWVGAMMVGTPGGPAPTLERAGFVMGSAAYEEIVFRIGALSVVWLVAKAVLHWLGAGERASAWGATLAGIVLSSLLFSAFHLGAWTAWLGPGGEPFDAAVFTWRTSAGILLAVLFLWRGVGVAAWAHASFNLALLLGAGANSIP